MLPQFVKIYGVRLDILYGGPVRNQANQRKEGVHYQK